MNADRAATVLSTAPIEPSLLPLTARADARGRLSVGGVDLCSLATDVGTPVFVYDEDHLRIRCREAVRAFPSGVAYASKAFLCKAMAVLVHEEGMAIDVSTGGELAVALAAGVPGERVVLHGNNKSDAELGAAAAAGVGRVVVDSFDEIDRIARLGAERGSFPQLMVRVNPGIEAHTHEFVRTGQEDSKFGFSLASGAATEAVRRLRAHPWSQVVGLHTHIGSQIFRLDSFEAFIDVIAPSVKELDLRELCIGGGLGVAYVAGESAPTLTEWASAVTSACERSGLGRDVRITAEPGRSIVAGAGITLYRVGTIKELVGIRTYVSVDGGMSDNPRPVLYGSGYEAFCPRAVTAPRPRVVTVVGQHCESGDVIVRDACVPEDLVVGDVLATPVTGAYGHSMASNYNKVPRPPVVFVSGGQVREVVRRETYDDLLRLDA